MKPTASRHAMDKDSNKNKGPTPPPAPPKHATTINVAPNGLRSPLTSPLESRLSGDLAQVIDKPDRRGKGPEDPHSGHGSLSKTGGRDVNRNSLQSSVSERDKREDLSVKTAAPSSQLKTNVTSFPSQPPPVSPKSTSFSSSAKPPTSPASSSPSLRHSKSPVGLPSPSANVQTHSLAHSSQSQSASVIKSLPPVLPRTDSGMTKSSTGATTTTINVNGHHSNGVTPAVVYDVTETEFYTSLPALPPDDFVQPPSPRYSLPPSPGTSSCSSPAPSLRSSTSSLVSERSYGGSRDKRPGSTTTTIIVGEHHQTAANLNPPPVPHKPTTDSPLSSLLPCPPPPPPPPPVLPKPPVGSLHNSAVSSHADSVTPPSQSDVSGQEQWKRFSNPENSDLGGLHAEVFHLSMPSTVNGASGTEAAGEGSARVVSESTFVGRRDVKDPGTLKERQIVSAKGTVRGFKNRVRAGIVTFIDPQTNKFNYRELEKGKIVVYTTSMTVVRETHDSCKAARNMLQTHMVRYEERDLYMSLENQRQLSERIGSHHPFTLPQIFIDGILIGGVEDLERLNESGELRKILEPFPKIQVRIMCHACGGYRFVPCTVCHGSKKSVHRNNFTEEFCALRCMHCNDNGLQRCPECLDQQE